MIEWSDKAIVLSTSKYGESSSIVSLFSSNHGLYRGLVRGMQSKKNRGLYEIGNIIDVQWKARLSEQLGFFNAELKLATPAHLLRDKVRLTSLVTLCGLLETTLPERDAHQETYHLVYSFIVSLVNKDSSYEWILYYIFLEIDILSYLGFQLELHKCADTQTTENLVYVSPKTGRAVCQTSGEPYKDKLLTLPPLLTHIKHHKQIPEISSDFILSQDDVRKSLALTGFFLNKCLTLHYRSTMPNMRSHLVDYLCEYELA